MNRLLPTALTTALAGAAVAVTVALPAAAATGGSAAVRHPELSRHSVTFESVVHLAGNLTASVTSGTFAVAGDLTDSGTEAGSGHFVGGGPTPTGRNELEATQTFTGAHGSVTLAIDGRFGPLPAQTAQGWGEWTVTSGTGDYAGVHGRGHWDAVADFTAAQAQAGPPTVTFVFTGSTHCLPDGGELMITCHEVRTVQASAEDAFDVIGTNVASNHPKWEKEVQSIRVVTPGPVRAGIRTVMVRKVLGRVHESEYEVTEFVPHRSIAFAHPGDALGFALCFEVTRVADHRCQLVVDVSARPTGVLRLMEPVMRVGFPRRARRITNAMVGVIETKAR